MTKRRKYSPELNREAVEQARDSWRELPACGTGTWHHS